MLPRINALKNILWSIAHCTFLQKAAHYNELGLVAPQAPGTIQSCAVLPATQEGHRLDNSMSHDNAVKTASDGYCTASKTTISDCDLTPILSSEATFHEGLSSLLPAQKGCDLASLGHAPCMALPAISTARCSLSLSIADDASRCCSVAPAAAAVPRPQMTPTWPKASTAPSPAAAVR